MTSVPAESALDAAVVGTPARCRNCNADFSAFNEKPKFCPSCGQDTHEHPPTVGEFLHEFVLHYVALEGKLWRTLGLLFFRPGALTVAYLRGLKAHYVPPLRIYLTASILFFLVVKFFGAGSLFRNNLDAEPTAAKPPVAVAQVRDEVQQALPADSPATPAVENAKNGLKVGAAKPQGVVVDGFTKSDLQRPAMDVLKCDLEVKACSKIREYLAQRYEGQTVAQMGAHVKANMVSFAPYAMFLFLPVFALLMKVVYRGRGMYYGEHLVYAFHVHAFSFFLLLGLAFAPESFGGVLALWGAAYYWWAMRRVYGGRWWAISLRYFTIGLIYPLLLTLLVVVVALAAIFL